MEDLHITRTDTLTTVHPPEHHHTLIWIHGLDQNNQHHLKAILFALQDTNKYVKIVIPKAPLRYVTLMKTQARSWFDVKFRNEKSFIVPFDQAFNSAEVHDSYQNHLQPLIKQERQLLKGKGKLVVAGFSQGCGMSLHCLYENPTQVDAAVGVAGYLFPFTKFDPNLPNQIFIICGLADKPRPWEFLKTTYEGKIDSQKITLVEKMGHEISEGTKKQLTKIFLHLFASQVQAKI